MFIPSTMRLLILLLFPIMLPAQGGFESMFGEAIEGKYMTSGEVGDLEDEELRLLRNAVFARHGYIFQSKDLKEYFGKLSWYHPQYADVIPMFTETDEDNVSMVRREERRRQRADMVTKSPDWADLGSPTNHELTEAEEPLVGMWHDGFSVGSGYGERYFFYPTRWVVWYANEMDCGKRLTAKVGRWRISGGILRISWTEWETYSGGRMVATDGEGSCASDSVLLGGLFTVTPPERVRMDELNMVVSPIEETDEIENNLQRISFDQNYYWKMCEDPFVCE